VIGFGHRLTAITILGRATPALDHWPVYPLLLTPRRPVFPECLVDLFPRPARQLLARYLDPDRWFRSVTRERLRRPTPAAIEQRTVRTNLCPGIHGQLQVHLKASI
jgi:hypothetical protein